MDICTRGGGGAFGESTEYLGGDHGGKLYLTNLFSFRVTQLVLLILLICFAHLVLFILFIFLVLVVFLILLVLVPMKIPWLHSSPLFLCLSDYAFGKFFLLCHVCVMVVSMWIFVFATPSSMKWHLWPSLQTLVKNYAQIIAAEIGCISFDQPNL